MKIKITGVDAAMANVKAAIKAANANALQNLVKKLAEATPVDTGKAAAGWKLEDGKIVNEVEYMPELNAGHSRQAPAHFIEHTVLNTDGVKANGSVVTYR